MGGHTTFGIQMGNSDSRRPTPGLLAAGGGDRNGISNYQASVVRIDRDTAKHAFGGGGGRSPTRTPQMLRRGKFSCQARNNSAEDNIVCHASDEFGKG